MHDDYAYCIDIYGDDGKALRQSELTPDWTAALEWVHFAGVRAARLPALMGPSLSHPAARVEPVWHERFGAPHVAAFRVSVWVDGAEAVRRDIPTAYVRDQVQRLATELVQNGDLKEGETFRYVVSAHRRTPNRSGVVVEAGFSVEEIPQPLPLREGSLRARLLEAVPGGQQIDDDFPVLLPRPLLEEVFELSRAARDVETGGVLVGHLHRDPSVPDVFVEVTAQITAAHTQAAAAKLTFTADTWAAVRAALALRRRGELMLGWWHFHPDFCRLRECPIEKRRVCTASSAFFSSEDVALHSTLFSRAFNTALLISDSAATDLTASIFGWRFGMVVARGFHSI